MRKEQVGRLNMGCSRKLRPTPGRQRMGGNDGLYCCENKELSSIAPPFASKEVSRLGDTRLVEVYGKTDKRNTASGSLQSRLCKRCMKGISAKKGQVNACPRREVQTIERWSCALYRLSLTQCEDCMNHVRRLQKRKPKSGRTQSEQSENGEFGRLSAFRC